MIGSAEPKDPVTRAMRSIVRKYPQYALAGKGCMVLYLYEPADPISTIWANLNVERRGSNPICPRDAENVVKAA